MAWTQEDLENIEAAIASGTKIVEYTDKKVEYNSLEELLKARDLIRQSLGVTSGRTKRIFSEFDRGY